MPGVASDPRVEDDNILVVDLTGTTTATRGDYMGWSAKGAIPMTAGQLGFPFSGIGVMLDQNPTWVGPDQSASALGRARIARRSLVRVTGTGAPSAGMYATPIDNGSGIVAQTGATGKAALWSAVAGAPSKLTSAITAVPTRFTAEGTASGLVSSYVYTINLNSGVAQIVRVISTGASGQWDIALIQPHALAAPGANA